MSEISIRDAVPDDAPGIARVHIDTWRTSYAGIVPDDYLAALDPEMRAQKCRERLENPPPGIIHLVAEECEAGVVGFVDGGKERGGHPLYGGELYGIYIAQAFQGRGLGARLLRELARLLSAQGHANLMLWVLERNYSARGFYERMGGRLVGSKQIDIGGAPLMEVAYGWEDLRSLVGAEAIGRNPI